MLTIANSLIPKEPDPLHRRVNSLNDPPQLKQWSIDRADLLRRLLRRRHITPHIRRRHNHLSRVIRFRSRQHHNKKIKYITSELERNKGCTRNPFSLPTPDGQHFTDRYTSPPSSTTSTTNSATRKAFSNQSPALATPTTYHANNHHRTYHYNAGS